MREGDTNLLKSKQHFEILDGLRGIAALAVVIFHFMEFAVPDYRENFIAHAYLAVDFFFCLSGFVIAYAYDQKLQKIGIISFFKLRLIRLHPLVIIGSVLGLILFVLDPYSNLYTVYGSGQTFLMFLTSCLMIPYPVVHERYFNLFHFNPPTWSLFWEYIANILYAFVLIKLRNKILWTLLVIAAFALCYESYKSSYLGVGWGGDNFMGGGVRIFYSFIAGMLVYRSKWMIRSGLGFISMGILLALVFFIPFSDKFNWFTDSLVVLLYFPLLIALGAGARLSSTLTKLCRFSGEISYPLYMIHYPFLWIFLSYIEENKPAMSEMVIIIPLATLFLVCLSYFTMLFLDIPIRKYLTSSMKQSLKTTPKAILNVQK